MILPVFNQIKSYVLIITSTLFTHSHVELNDL